MGSWGTELLENDSALDAIGDLVAELAAAAAKTGSKLEPDGAAPFEPTLLDPKETSDASRADELHSIAIVVNNRAVLDSLAPGAKTSIWRDRIHLDVSLLDNSDTVASAA